jgi:hypothetical protein
MDRDPNASRSISISGGQPRRQIPQSNQIGGVRRSIWLLLAGSLLLSLAVPAWRLWHDASSRLVAQVSLMPAAPQVGQPAQLVVTLPDEGDRVAVHGPWATLAASWDMVTMSMGARRAALAGPSLASTSAPAFKVPLALDMAGLWVARVSLTTPGRPSWQTSLRFSVLPATASAAAVPQADARAVDGGPA